MSKPLKYKRIEIHGKFEGKCAYCGEKIEVSEMQVDHVIPQSSLMYNLEGDQFKNPDKIPHFLRHISPCNLNHSDNLFPACRICNKWKDGHSLERFRKEISLQPKRMIRDSAAFRMALRYELIMPNPQPVVFWFEFSNGYYCKECRGPCRRKKVRFPGEEEDDE